MNSVEFAEILMRIIEEKSMGLEPEINGVVEISKEGHSGIIVKTKDRTFEVTVL